MEQFERQFEHLDVQTQTMDEAMSGVTTLNTPEVGLCNNWNNNIIIITFVYVLLNIFDEYLPLIAQYLPLVIGSSDRTYATSIR